jgi:hypothetical protein
MLTVPYGEQCPIAFRRATWMRYTCSKILHAGPSMGRISYVPVQLGRVTGLRDARVEEMLRLEMPARPLAVPGELYSQEVAPIAVHAVAHLSNQFAISIAYGERGSPHQGAFDLQTGT